MKTYDAVCPCCGHRNTGLYLEETDGFMECEKCGSITKGIACMETGLLPVLHVQNRPEASGCPGFPGGTV